MNISALNSLSILGCDIQNTYLTACSAAKIVSWKRHVDSKTNSRYDIILGRDLLTALGLDLRFSENIIICGEGTYEGCLTPMVDSSNYDFKSLTENIVKLEESFINLYVRKSPKSESTIISTHIMRLILYSKYEKADLNKVATEKCQHLRPN